MSAPESLRLPSSVTAATFSSSGHLGVAGDDGTIRVYEAPYKKVWKAVKSLGSEVSSLLFVKSDKVETVSAWVACGQNILCFELGSASKMILMESDALIKIQVTEEDDDVLNEIAFNGSHLAYSLDSGASGVIDIISQEKTVMKTSHSNLCTNVSFIPNRPRELVSGGYDFTLLHFDFSLGKFLSSMKFEGPSEPSAQVSLSPPFIQSMAISPNGLLACGLADGRIWLGSGGERIPTSEKNTSVSKKKRRKWEGLNSDAGNYTQIAEGPVIGIAFASTSRIFTLTLLGILALNNINDGRVGEKIWTTSSESHGLSKANTLAINGTHVAVGGIDSAGKGVLLIWPLECCERQSTSLSLDTEESLNAA